MRHMFSSNLVGFSLFRLCGLSAILSLSTGCATNPFEIGPYDDKYNAVITNSGWVATPSELVEEAEGYCARFGQLAKIKSTSGSIVLFECIEGGAS